jgi:hypothetical protein
VGGETTNPKSVLDLGEGPTLDWTKESTEEELDWTKESTEEEPPEEPPRNKVVKSASAPANSTFAGAEAQNPRRREIEDSSVKASKTRIGTSHSAANFDQESGRIPQPDGQPDEAKRTRAPRSEAGNRPH